MTASNTYSPSPNRINNCEVVPTATTNSTCTRCVPPFATGVVTDTPQCSQQCISNCDDCIIGCSGAGCLVCRKCGEGTYPVQSAQVSLNRATHTNVTECRPCQESSQVLNQGCSECPSGKCSQCFDGYIASPQPDGSVSCDGLHYSPCHSDCLQCYGLLVSQCTKCQDGKYLDGSTCKAKSGVIQPKDIFIVATNSTSLSAESGSFSKPFSDLLRAIEHALMLSAPSISVTVNIWISNETHFILPNPENIWLENTSPRSEDVSGLVMSIKPLVCGSTIGGAMVTSANTKCGTSTHKPKFLNKIGGFFKFRVGKMLKIENIEIDSIDSQLQFGQACKNSKVQCCQFQGSQVSGTGCGQSHPQHCSIPGGVSMFSFRTSSTSTTPGQLTLSKVDLTHILHPLHSLIQVSNNIGLIQFEHSSITNFGTCASVISNVNPIFQNYHEPEGVSVSGKEASIIQKRSVRGRQREFNQLNPNNQITGCTPCTQVKLLNLTVDSYFSGFPQLTQIYKGPYFITGFILNLNQYKGYTLVKDSTIKKSQIQIASCGIFTSQTSLSSGSIFTSDTPMEMAFISIHTNQEIVEIISTTFSKNSGFQGSLVKVDNKQDFGVILKGNVFTQNSGGFNTKVVEVLSIGKCGGVVLESNQFLQNIRCPLSNESESTHPSLIMLKCLNRDQAVAQAGTPQTLITPEGVSFGSTQFQVRSNIYRENFYSFSYLVSLYQLADVHVSNEEYSENVGNIFLKAAEKYSPFKTTLGDFSTQFKSWGAGQYQGYNRLVQLYQNQKIMFEGVTVSDPADLSPRSDLNRMVLLHLTTIKQSTVTFKNIKINRVNGGNETAIRRYTTEPITTNASINYYKVGGTELKKGSFWVGLIKLEFGSIEQTFVWDGLEIVDVHGTINSTTSRPMLELLGTKCVQNFTMKNVVIKNLICSKGYIYLFYFQHTQYSHFYFHNFTVEQFGENENERLMRPVFYLKPQNLTKNGSSIVFNGLHLKNIFNNHAGVMYSYAATSSSTVSTQRVVFNGGTITNNTNYFGLFYFAAGYNGVQLEFNGMDVRYMKSLYYRYGGFASMRLNHQKTGSLKITNSSFYHIRFVQKSRAYAYMVNAIDLTKLNTLEFDNVKIDCARPYMTREQALATDFGQNLPNSQLVRAVFYLKYTVNKFRNMHISNCDRLQYGAIYPRRDPHILNVTIENCTGIFTAGFNFNIGYDSYANLEQFHTINNKAKYGPSYYLQSGSILLKNSTFTNGFGYSAGAVYTIKNPNHDWFDVVVSDCEGVQEGAVQFVNMPDNMTSFTRVSFINNTGGSRGIVGLSSSDLNLHDCQFIDNTARSGYAGVYSIQSRVYMSNTNFTSTVPSLNSNGYISILLGSTITVTNSHFTGGHFKSGGALMVDGNSVVTIDKSTFTGIRVKNYGGAFYLTNFGTLTLSNSVIKDCWNSENHLGGGTIYSQLGGNLIIKNSKLLLTSVSLTQNLMYASEIEADFDNLTINASGNAYSQNQIGLVEKAGGVEFVNMVKIVFNNSIVEGVKGTQKGGIGLKYTQISLNEDSFHQLSNLLIKNNEAKLYGGGMHLANVLNVAFSNMSVRENKVMNGQGGGLYFQTQKTNQAISVKFDKDCSVTGNSVNGSGGAISWNYYSPQNLPPIIQRNTATLYGGQFSSYPSKIRISNSSRALFLSGIKSGGVIPTIKAAIVDKFDQIVKSDSHSIVTLQAISNSTKFSTVLKGQTTIVAQNGEVKFEGNIIISQPGTSLSLTISTNGIDPELPDNKANGFGKSTTQSISTRSCLEGEAFLATGECRTCTPFIEYSIVSLNTTGACQKCNTQQMVCLGGNRIGPRSGYWRISKTSDTFYTCLRSQACLGMRAPSFTPIGDCFRGFTGKLCAQCQDGYSMTGQFNCSKCPNLVFNILRLVGTFLGALLIIVILVKMTIQGAHKRKKLESIYVKVLTNHFQLVFLCSTFEFSWPENVQKFFSTQEPVANASTQFLSIQCLLDEFKNGFSKFGIDTYYFVLLQYGLFPILLMITSLAFWSVKSFRCLGGNPRVLVSRVIGTIVILMFLIHPAIVSTMFESINCKQVEGKMFIQTQIAIECYTTSHMRWILAVTIPSLVVWGLGTPIVAWLLLSKNRNRLTTIEIKQKYGFLYNRYKKTRYYWECVIMFRKIAVIFISVILKSQGTIAQALCVALLLVIFLMITLQLKPFSIPQLNQMEYLSLNASLITVYCGFFFLSHRPEVYNSDNQSVQSADNGLRINEETNILLFLIIVISNTIFTLVWIFKFVQELLKSVKTTLPSIYILVCLCAKKVSFDEDLKETKIVEESKALREDVEEMVGKLLKAIDDQDIRLTPNIVEKLGVYLNVQNVKNSINYKCPLRKLEPAVIDMDMEQTRFVKTHFDEKDETTRGVLVIPETNRMHLPTTKTQKVQSSIPKKKEITSPRRDTIARHSKRKQTHQDFELDIKLDLDNIEMNQATYFDLPEPKVIKPINS